MTSSTTLALGLYARISLDRLDLAVGVKRQLRELHDAVDRRVWPGFAFGAVTEYVDNDRSASKPGGIRPAYDRLVADIFDGTVNAVGVRELSRLWRQEVQALQFLDELERRRIVLHVFSLTAGHYAVGFGMPESRFIVTQLIGLAAHEVRMKGTRHVSDHADRRARGIVHGGGRRRYGYDRQMRPVPEEAAQIRAWCSAVLAGTSMLSIARQLNADGVPTVTGAPWSQSAIRWVLNRPDIAGYVTYKGRVVGDAVHEPIVDRETWAAVQTTLADPSRRHRRTRRSPNLLTGLLTDEAGRRMTVGTVGRSQALSYRTSVDFATPKADRPRVTSGRVAGVDAAVEAMLLRFTDRHALLAPTVDTAERDALEADRAELAARLAEADRRFALPQSDPQCIDWARYDALTAQLSKAIAALDDALATMRIAVSADLLALLREPGALRARWETLDIDERRTVLGAAFERIILLPATRKGAGFDPLRLRLIPTAAARQRWDAAALSGPGAAAAAVA